MLKLDVNRREFLKIAAGTGAALTMPTSGHPAVSSKMIGIHVGAVSLLMKAPRESSMCFRNVPA